MGMRKFQAWTYPMTDAKEDVNANGSAEASGKKFRIATKRPSTRTMKIANVILENMFFAPSVSPQPETELDINYSTKKAADDCQQRWAYDLRERRGAEIVYRERG